MKGPALDLKGMVLRKARVLNLSEFTLCWVRWTLKPNTNTHAPENSDIKEKLNQYHRTEDDGVKVVAHKSHSVVLCETSQSNEMT